ncbi:MAG TPA: glycine oxidase ThiO [Candidatus Polarisedimenticolia bacterium]|nr:glycine oxidase ThiO [Candidatus Polarisedimenticolia bacterium]
MKSWDVIIVGAGIIGVSLALELRKRGALVLVLDRVEPGSEASSAAAGMLAAADPETPIALRLLAMESARMFPEFVQKVETAGNMQVDFRRIGTIALLTETSAPDEYRSLSRAELQLLAPSVHSSGQSAFFVQEDSVDPSLLMQAALATARNLGIEIRGHTAVKGIRAHDRAVEVLTDAENHAAASVVDCRGAWFGKPVRPRKGQMLYVQPQLGLLQHVLRAPEVYIVPRSSGKILIGATVEDVGFDKSVDPSAIQQLLNAAEKYLPELVSAPITHSWAGLRPGTPDDLPIIGPTDASRVFVATGHFRNGILLAPITAQIMADLIGGRPSPMDISAFAVKRFLSTGR